MMVEKIETGYLEENCYIVSIDNDCLIIDPGDDFDKIKALVNKSQSIGLFSFEIIPTKGHKEDAVTYYFKDEKIMFVGDFIFKGTIGRCDLEGGNINDMMKSLKMIKTYDEEIMLYPGHGENTTLKEELENNPYMRGDIDE